MFNVSEIRQDFPMFKNNPQLVYFDSSATSFKPQIVIDQINAFYQKETANVHRGDYRLSYLVSNQYEETREVVKKFINASNAKEIVFTSGASASLNTVAFGWGLQHLKKDDVILSSEAEHASNLLPWYRVCALTGAKMEFISLNKDGTFNLDLYKEALNSKVKVVSLAAITNVLGYSLPIKDISSLAHQLGAIVVIDGAQYVPHCCTNVQEEDIDFLAFSAHKMCGPSGVGVLYGKYQLLNETDPLFYGGGANARFDNCGNIQLKEVPYKFEAGTPNIEGVLGLKAAIEYLNSIGMDNIKNYEEQLVSYLQNRMRELKNITIYNGASKTGICSFGVEGIFSQDVAAYLNKFNIAVRAGNHCAKILHNIIGVYDTVRASLYFYNTTEEIDYFINVLKDISLDKCVGVVI